MFLCFGSPGLLFFCSFFEFVYLSLFVLLLRVSFCVTCAYVYENLHV
jgi:hypothetical protein